MAVPCAISDISVPWLNEVFSCPDGNRVVAFHSEVIGGGAGLLGELARVSLEWEREAPDLPRTVIGKFSAFVEEARAVAGSMGFYEMEHRFYTDLSARIPIRVPVCHFSFFDPDSQRFVLVMTDVEGTVVDQVEGCPIGWAERAVDALVALHAWGQQEDVKPWLEWVRPVSDAVLHEAVQAALVQNIPVTLQNLGACGPTWLPDAAGNFLAIHNATVMQLETMPRTLLHGDFRADNLVFDADDNLTVIDWQILLRGPGAFDLVYFMMQSLSVDDRRRHGDALIGRYKEGMAAAGAPVDDEAFEAAFRTATCYVLCYPLVGGGIVDDNFPRSRQLATEMLVRSCAAVEDYDLVDVMLGRSHVEAL